MIDPKSLRIGNYLLHDGKVIVVTDIRSNELPEHGYKGSVSGEILDDPYRTHVAPWLAKCSGIPLSEQELIRLGANIYHPQKAHHGTSYRLHSGNKGITLKRHNDGPFYLSIPARFIIIETVNRLQNVFFTLCEEELTYKVENETVRQ